MSHPEPSMVCSQTAVSPRTRPDRPGPRCSCARDHRPRAGRTTPSMRRPRSRCTRRAAEDLARAVGGDALVGLPADENVASEAPVAHGDHARCEGRAARPDASFDRVHGPRAHLALPTPTATCAGTRLTPPGERSSSGSAVRPPSGLRRRGRVTPRSRAPRTRVPRRDRAVAGLGRWHPRRCYEASRTR